MNFCRSYGVTTICIVRSVNIINYLNLRYRDANARFRNCNSPHSPGSAFTFIYAGQVASNCGTLRFLIHTSKEQVAVNRLHGYCIGNCCYTYFKCSITGIINSCCVTASNSSPCEFIVSDSMLQLWVKVRSGIFVPINVHPPSVISSSTSEGHKVNIGS